MMLCEVSFLVEEFVTMLSLRHKSLRNRWLRLTLSKLLAILHFWLMCMLLLKRWQNVAAVRQKMIKLGVRKPPGRSWVQINGVLLDYVGGDSAHNHASLIYKMLGEITMQATREGYNPDLSELFLGIKE